MKGIERKEVRLKGKYHYQQFFRGFNGSLITTLGVFIHISDTLTPSRIEFNKKFIENGKYKDIISVIKHECIHYAMYMLGRPFKDWDKEFEKELQLHDAAPNTQDIDYYVERNVRVYKCKCREHIQFAIISPSVCTKCNYRLIYQGTRKQLA
ncbi:SprT-like domain-containing protein [Fictibacillus nanhaiensis]|uniref:SprT-like domain-containing protein n=1 Tax=Fictibacillus nanhaiensis TaxID=742169 RepID=UPI002E23E34A|nr:SprT-like domain-containing protein [Fictibacillus nanhaiensis]